MPPMNLSWTVFGRPIKPVAIVLMNTMFVLGIIGITDQGDLVDSEWADVTGSIAMGVAALFIYGFWAKSQKAAEVALIGAFFVWGVRFWSFFLVQGPAAFEHESIWLAGSWMFLCAGSWLLERADPHVHNPKERGSKWSRR